VQIDLRHLRTLIALRDTGSLVEAAERVFLTQSALSHQIKELETRLGCTVFIRKTRPVRFTSAGKRLLDAADQILPILRSAKTDIERIAGGQTGRLYMAIECHSCFEWLLPAINAYREQWPEVELDLLSGFHFQPLPALARGDLDLVITADPIFGNGLAYIPLFSYEAVTILAMDHPLVEKEYVEPLDFVDETLIAYPVDRERMDFFKSFMDLAGVEPARVRSAELTTMMVQLVASGRGVACLPNWAVHEYSKKNYIVSKSLGEEGIWPNLYAAVRTDQLKDPFIESFANIAKESCFDNLVGIVPVDNESAVS
tara:strand:- start:988 stop:1926 length:939 start_codon:yes stop_codon:yes gene_type:complete